MLLPASLRRGDGTKGAALALSLVAAAAAAAAEEDDDDSEPLA